MIQSIEILPYRAEHMAGVKVREVEGVEAEIVNSEQYRKWLETAGPGYSLIVEGKTVGSIVFCNLMVPWIAEVVALVSPEMPKHKSIVHRVCKKLVGDAQAQHGYQRLQCRIAVSAIRNRRWVEALGFKEEGPAYAFGEHGEDYIHYSRVRGIHGGTHTV